MEPLNEQTDLFGNPVKLDVLANKKGVKMIDRLHAAHGIDDQGRRCKDCVNFRRKHLGKVYFKCSLASDTASERTDIRANDVACGKFEHYKGE